MSYIDYTYYSNLYGTKAMSEADFTRLDYLAERYVSSATTTADGTCKLAEAFPTDEDAVEAVKRCACAVVDMMYRIDVAESEAESANALTETADGNVHYKTIASVNTGSESISFTSNRTSASTVTSVVGNKAEQTKLINQIIREYLRGINDSNGVSLLFSGTYPWGLL